MPRDASEFDPLDLARIRKVMTHLIREGLDIELLLKPDETCS
jgi:hypothetical protein